jgi:cholesterol transport system auxiliary component
MTQPLPRRELYLLALLPLLAGCGGLIPEPPKRQLYRALPSFTFPPGLPRLPTQLLVAMPSASAAIDSARIALSRSRVELDYYADAIWTDHVPFLVRDALIQGFERSGTVAAAAPEGVGLRGEYVLDTAIGDFQAVYDSPKGPPLVRVRLEPRLVRIGERKIVARTSVIGERRAAADTLPEIVTAFGAALGEAVQQVVAWTAVNPALSGQR